MSSSACIFSLWGFKCNCKIKLPMKCYSTSNIWLNSPFPIALCENFSMKGLSERKRGKDVNVWGLAHQKRLERHPNRPLTITVFLLSAFLVFSISKITDDQHPLLLSVLWWQSCAVGSSSWYVATRSATQSTCTPTHLLWAEHPSGPWTAELWTKFPRTPWTHSLLGEVLHFKSPVLSSKLNYMLSCNGNQWIFPILNPFLFKQNNSVSSNPYRKYITNFFFKYSNLSREHQLDVGVNKESI